MLRPRNNVNKLNKITGQLSKQSASASERTRACAVRKHLPKDPELKCKTIIRLFLHALSDFSTGDIMRNEMLTNEKFAKSVMDLKNHMTSEAQEVNKIIRQAYTYRCKKSNKLATLTEKLKEIRKKYTVRQVQTFTQLNYRQCYQLLHNTAYSKGKRKVTLQDRLSVARVVLKTTHSMQIPYRRFAKYFYLRESIKETYKAYVREQKELGLRILSESAMYKNLPRYVRSQKYIPFMECLCVKCLNISHLIDALLAVGVVVDRRAILHVIASICPFHMDKDYFQDIDVQKSEDVDAKKSSTQKHVIQFGKVETIEYDTNSGQIQNTSQSSITNEGTQIEKKHDPNKFLLNSNNAPGNISTELVIKNCSPACMFRECDQCGVHLLYQKIHQNNEKLSDRYDDPVVWYKWCSHTEIVDGKEVVRPFNKYRFDGSLQELLQLFYDAVHNISKHLFHFKWQATQFEELKNTLQPGEVAAVMDFGQNINHRKQRESQSSHYSRRQSTIFPVVCYFTCDLCESLVTHEICCISDDLKHDAFAVRAFEMEALKVLHSHGVSVRKLYEWTDNCALEFKSKFPFFVLSTMEQVTNRSYWGENHGKGPADAVIGRVSQVMRSAIARNKTSVSHGIDMVIYLESHLGTGLYDSSQLICQHYRRSFVFVDTIPRELSKLKLKTLKGTREFHCIENTGVPGMLQIRRSSCMCRCAASISP